MAALTDYAENKLIDFLFRSQQLGIGGSTAVASLGSGGAGTGLTNLYVGLFTNAGAAPTDAGGGTEVSSGIGYSRVAVTNGMGAWDNTQASGTSVASTGTSGTTKNTAIIQFGAPTGNWGTITHFGIFDASTGGNLLVYGQLTASKTVNNNDAAPSFAAGALQFTLDN